MTDSRAWRRILPVLKFEFEGELLRKEQLNEVPGEHGSTELLVTQVQTLKLILNIVARTTTKRLEQHIREVCKGLASHVWRYFQHQPILGVVFLDIVGGSGKLLREFEILFDELVGAALLDQNTK